MEEKTAAGPVSILLTEHRIIERMFQLLAGELGKVEQGKSPDVVFLDGAVEFAGTYADAGHHGKEERILFDKLAGKELPPDFKKLMDELVLQHIQVRKLAANAEIARQACLKGDPSAVGAILGVCKGLIQFYPGHLKREEADFFPRAMDYLALPEREDLARQFREFDREILLSKYLGFLDRHER